MKNNRHTPQSPLALFDDRDHIGQLPERILQGEQAQQDYLHGVAFLKSYKGSQGTFNAYRREVERLLQWTHLEGKGLKDLRREDMEHFIHFCQDPPQSWIGLKKVPRFMEKEGLRSPNPAWRPFVVTLSKTAHREGHRPLIKNFELSVASTKEMFAILSSFYTYLMQEDYVAMNPIALIRQKSQFIRRHQGSPKIRRLSELQWQYVMTTVQGLAEKEPAKHERTLFMMSALYAMYLRISELAASPRWIPEMHHFYSDHEGHWWFTTVGKGNKQRQIAVSDHMLTALKRWRGYLGLSALPSAADKSALFPKNKGKGPITSTTYVRSIVQDCFDKAIIQLKQDGFEEEAGSLVEATVHWLRHTGISDDVKHRPREHVRDDAGHSSSAITDKYIDIELRDRHRSAKDKPILD